MTRCIDEGQLRAFLDGALSEGERAEAEGHLAGCDGCTAKLEELRKLGTQVDALIAGYAPSPDANAAFARLKSEVSIGQPESVVIGRHRSEGQFLFPTHPHQNRQRPARPWPVRWRFVFSGLAVAAVMLGIVGLLSYFGPQAPYGISVPAPPTPADPTKEYPRVGWRAPGFTLLDVKTNRPISLTSLRGKPVWLNFWGTWCPPCQVQMDEIQSLHERYAGQIEILSISMGWRDEPEGVATFVGEHNYQWTFIHDPSMEMIDTFAVQGLPASYFIDKDGVIRSISVGEEPASTLERELLKAISPAPVPVETRLADEPEIIPIIPIGEPAAPVDPPRMPLEEFKLLYDDPATRLLILDVRSREAYNEGHIAGAISFPEADVDKRVSELPKNRLIVAYCQ